MLSEVLSDFREKFNSQYAKEKEEYDFPIDNEEVLG